MQTNLDEFLQQHREMVEANLKELLPSASNLPHQLYVAMRYSVLNSGKRLRPILVYAVGQALGVPTEKLHAAAMSVELVHCYSLVHDDLPAMDDDNLRRGIPTCHIAFDEATAILAGDALQSLAFEVLTDTELNPVSAPQQVLMLQALARAIGANGMVLGQAEDMAAEHRSLGLNELITLHSHKTGALFKVCVELALIAANQQDEQLRDNLLSFGQQLGLAFQIQDDVLDLTSTEQVLGKPQGSDLKHDKSTFPSILGLEAAEQYATTTLTAAVQALEPFGEQADLLRSLASYLTNRSS